MFVFKHYLHIHISVWAELRTLECFNLVVHKVTTVLYLEGKISLNTTRAVVLLGLYEIQNATFLLLPTEIL